MRADRLLSILLLLQARGRLSARELATELEVSERTIYRDIDALNAAGAPVYGEAGRAGGFALLEPYRTTLTGLTRAEIRALFMLSVPEPLADLGMSRDLHSALRKLAAALPGVHATDETWVRQRFYLDSTWWRHGDDMLPHLDTIHQAIREERQLELAYRPFANWNISQRIHPFGLVAKAGAWYLVGGHHERVDVYRVATITEARIIDDPVSRPVAFDLRAFWKNWCEEQEGRAERYLARVAVAPHFIAALPAYFGEQVHARIANGQPQPDGRLVIELAFESLEAARDRILTLGYGVEALAPRELRLSVLDFARQIAAVYERLKVEG